MKSLTFSYLICALSLNFAQRLLEPQKVAPNVKRCSKVSKHNRERSNPDDWGYLSQPRLIKRTELVHILYRIYRLVSI